MIGQIKIEEVGTNRLDRLNKILAGIGNGGGAIKAAHAALKRSAETADTKAGRLVAERYTLTQGGFKSHVTHKVKVSGGSGGVSSVSISYAGAVIPLLDFKAGVSKSGGITVSVKKGGGGTLSHAFAASIYGSTAIFERKGTSRFPVEQKFGPSAGSIMKNDEIDEEMAKTIDETFSKRMEVEIARILNGW